jgi:hypothetical protein
LNVEWVIITVFLQIGSPQGGIRATSADIKPEEVELAEFVLQGMKTNRDLLQSGVFRTRGRKKLAAEPGAIPAMDEPIEYFCAFDFARGMFRFDAQDWARIGFSEDTARAKQGVVEVSKSDGKYVRTPKSSLHWSGHVPYRLIVDDPNSEPSRLEMVFDVRCLGMGFRHDLERFVEFPRLCELLSEQNIVEVAKEGNVYRIAWLYGKYRNLKRTIWFDEQRGYSPIRLEGIAPASSPSATKQICEVSWDKLSDVWVPLTLCLEKVKGDKQEYKLDMAFEWESVNTPVPDRAFAAEGLGLPPSTEMVSTQLGKPVSLGRVAGRPEDPPLPEGDSAWTTRVVAVSIGLAIILMLLVTWTVRRYSAGHA